MTVQRTREEEEEMEAEARRNGAYISGVVADKMEAALARINGDDEKDKDDKKKDQKSKKDDKKFLVEKKDNNQKQNDKTKIEVVPDNTTFYVGDKGSHLCAGPMEGSLYKYTCFLTEKSGRLIQFTIKK